MDVEGGKTSTLRRRDRVRDINRKAKGVATTDEANDEPLFSKFGTSLDLGGPEGQTYQSTRRKTKRPKQQSGKSGDSAALTIGVVVVGVLFVSFIGYSLGHQFGWY